MAEVAELLAQKIKEFEAKSSDSKPLPAATKARIRDRRARLKNLTNIVHQRADPDGTFPQDGADPECARQECLASLHDELSMKKNLENLTQSVQRKINEIAKEKDRLSAELSRAMQAKAKVEQACKDLQKRQRVLEEENKRISGAEERRRLNLEASCHSTIEGVRQKMEQQQSERSIQQKENEELRERFETFLEKYEDRERVLKEQQETRDREMSLFRERLADRDKLHAEERKRTEELREENARLMAVESELRQQLQSYADRFNTLQQALQTSNDGFENYKLQMDELQSEMQAVRKENEGLQETIKRGPLIKKQMLALGKLLETLRAQRQKGQNEVANPGGDCPPIGTSSSSSSSCAPRR
eukprot:GEMP01030018.1.p1 GENE.GEMP01030018.1~~GEMP01030018.1.p1  ORF type:complete len:369 (+),score=91.49 GEMP01030018.1:28-1107(+)